jgi:hypothetical protein
MYAAMGSTGDLGFEVRCFYDFVKVYTILKTFSIGIAVCAFPNALLAQRDV